jgi:hypothetical protein
LSLVDPDSPVALRLRIRLAGEADYQAGTSGAILPLLEEARRVGDPVARAEALSITHHCLLGPEHGALRRLLAAELVAESFGTARRSDLLMGLLWQTVDMLLDADPHAGRRLGELREMLTVEDHLAVGFVVDAIDVMFTIRAGDFARREARPVLCPAGAPTRATSTPPAGTARSWSPSRGTRADWSSCYPCSRSWPIPRR